MQCPKCGRFLIETTSYSGVNAGVQLWKCPCGYSSEYDATGLTHSNVIDRYKFAMINEVKKNDRSY